MQTSAKVVSASPVTRTRGSGPRRQGNPRRLHFGGTFNPIHLGHLICARAAAEALGFDKVVLIPSGRPPHRNDPDLALAEHRLAMCQSAVAQDRMFEVSDVELRRDGPSYTHATAGVLGEQLGLPIDWLIGADQLPTLPSWKDAATLPQRVRFHVMRRPEHAIDWSAIPAPWDEIRDRAVQTPRVEISATVVRERLRTGLSIRYLVPHTVNDYIREHRLYTA
ncbi:MAG: nicotinate (nicotinamide) nucleotide adenylyltransferase [Planctomycetota bacterium]